MRGDTLTKATIARLLKNDLMGVSLVNFVESLFFNNLEPQKLDVKNHTDFQKDMNRLSEIETELNEKLTDAEKELFLEYVGIWGIVTGELEFSSFKSGFKHGAGFALAAYSD